MATIHLKLGSWPRNSAANHVYMGSQSTGAVVAVHDGRLSKGIRMGIIRKGVMRKGIMRMGRDTFM